ncbi:MAG: CHASE3 domain-containing protein [Pseudolabrys sp.]|nr:CHASE3 domain-containing protein [Pseudolabrys sp.]MCW5685116.1 CHASE3 domain-containing protein [Pseudolabrys sp.]
MPTSLSTDRNLTQPLLLLAGFALLIGISVGTLWLVDRATDDARSVAHTLRVQDMMSNVLLNMRRAEAGQRGYLFTNAARYLDDYNEAGPQAEEQLRLLREQTADNPTRKSEIDLIERTMNQKFAEMDQTIELAKAGRIEDARSVVLGDTGRTFMNNLRQQIEKLIDDEGRLLTERSQASQRTNRLLLILTILGAALVVVVGGIAVLLMRRNIAQREAARQELAVINANLERIVEFRTADLVEANEEIQRFAYIVSHDLRSPLVNIMGFTSELEALRKDIFEEIGKLRAQLDELNAHAAAQAVPVETLGKDFDEALGFIKTSIAKMDRLINAVLKLSREGRRRFNPETIDMNGMLGSIGQTVAHRAAEQGAEVTIGDLPPLESDTLAIEQIFSNLIDNALKYSRADEPNRIAVTGHANSAYVSFDVTDHGRGIDPHDHQRVFELFRRSGVQDRPGEGIGLAHVRALVRRMGGTLKLKSELGKGSTFTVTLPRRWTENTRSVA